jgi:hypothetical protein
VLDRFRELFYLEPVCFGSETDSAADTGSRRLRVQRTTVASRISRQPFRARAALRTSAATSLIWVWSAKERSVAMQPPS